jgi:hypothetical protein
MSDFERSLFPDLPAGRVVVAAPGDAARLAEHRPDLAAKRVFTFPGLEEGKAYVLDVDAARKSLGDALDRFEI